MSADWWMKTKKINKRLNVDKIKDLEDVKRVLDFMNIQVELSEGIGRVGFDEVEDLFE